MHNLMTLDDAPAKFRVLYLEESRALLKVLDASVPERLRVRLEEMLTL